MKRIKKAKRGKFITMILRSLILSFICNICILVFTTRGKNINENTKKKL